MSEPVPSRIDAADPLDEEIADPGGSGAAGDRGSFGFVSWIRPRVASAAVLLGALALWWLVTVGLAPPDDVIRRFDPVGGARALGRLLGNGELLPHVVVSLRRLGIGLGVAAILGVAIGVAIGWWRSLEGAVGPLVQLVRMISPLAWTPIVIVVVGIGDRPVQVLVALAAVWPIVLNTSAGVRALDPGWLLVARSLGATRRELVRTILVPGIVDHVLTGLRLALGVGWIVLVPAEMLGVDSGLGYFVLDCRDRLAYDELVATIVVIGVLGAILDGGIRRLHGVVGSSRRRRNRRPRREALLPA